MRTCLTKACLAGICFGTAGAVALATDCRLDSAVDCCERTTLFQFYASSAPPECPPLAFSSPWLPRTIPHENGYTAIQITEDVCGFVYFSLENGFCVQSPPQYTYCHGNRVADNSIPSNGGGANP